MDLFVLILPNGTLASLQQRRRSGPPALSLSLSAATAPLLFRSSGGGDPSGRGLVPFFCWSTSVRHWNTSQFIIKISEMSLFELCFDVDPPYEEAATEEDDSSDPEDFTEEGLKAKEVVLGLSKSIVSLVSSVEGKRLFACTGAVVDHWRSATWMLTSATLVRKPGTDHDAYQANEVKIQVLLHNKKIIVGRLAMCNLQYNIALVSVESQLGLPMVALNDLSGCYSTLVRPVIAVGRDSESQGLLMRLGDMIRKRSKLDCSELLVCTCPVSKTFIGGLVIDFERRIVGITFCGKDTTPVMPIEIAARCLEHFKCFGTLKQPCLCIRGHTLHSSKISNLDNIWSVFPDGIGIVVDKISGVLSENCGGIEADDIICSIDGVALHSVAQLTVILLDTMVAAMSSQNTVILQASIQRPRDNTKFVAMLNIRENGSVGCDNSFCNRWALP